MTRGQTMHDVIGKSFSLALMMGLVGAGCEGDGDGKGARKNEMGSAPETSGVDGAKKLVDLSKADARKLCEWTQTMLPSDAAICMSTAVVFGQDSAQCEMLYDECLMAGTTFVDEDDCASDEGDEDDELPAGCQASVAELESCMTDSSKRGKERLETLSCADAGSGVSAFDPSLPASCQALETSCPGFFGSDDDASE